MSYAPYNSEETAGFVAGHHHHHNNHYSFASAEHQTGGYQGAMPDSSATVPRSSYYVESTTSSSDPATIGFSSGYYYAPTQSYAAASMVADPQFSSTVSTVDSSYSRTSEEPYAHSQMHPPADGPYLPCDFVGMQWCNERFHVDDMMNWINHIQYFHLRNNFPESVMCWYCDVRFEATSTKPKDLLANFQARLTHIREHIVNEGKDENFIRVDCHYAEFLYNAGLISMSTYLNAKTWTDSVQLADGTYRRMPSMEGIYRPPSPREDGSSQQETRQIQVANSQRERRRKRRQVT